MHDMKHANLFVAMQKTQPQQERMLPSLEPSSHLKNLSEHCLWWLTINSSVLFLKQRRKACFAQRNEKLPCCRSFEKNMLSELTLRSVALPCGWRACCCGSEKFIPRSRTRDNINIVPMRSGCVLGPQNNRCRGEKQEAGFCLVFVWGRR